MIPTETISHQIKLLYILRDDKFFLSNMTIFNKNPEIYDVTYAVFKPTKKDLIYAKDIINLRLFSSLQEFSALFNDYEFDYVFFETMCYEHWKFILNVPINIKVIVWLWGMDIYNNRNFASPLMPLKYCKIAPQTRSFVLKKLPLYYIKAVIKKFIGILSMGRFNKQQEEVLKRIDFIMPILSIEGEILKKTYNLQATTVKAISRYLENDDQKQNAFNYFDKPQNILLGNSAHVVNNHIDILTKLNQIKPENQLIIPLSYGNIRYKNILKQYLFKQCLVRYRVLDQMMPCDEYFNLLNTCSHAIFGGFRQYAVGNIVKLLRNGTKIFFWKESLLYEYFKREGYIVFSIEKDLNATALDEPLSKADALHNYEIFYKSFAEPCFFYQVIQDHKKRNA